MPDGGRLTAYLGSNAPAKKQGRKDKQLRGKDSLWMQIQRSKGGHALSEAEAAELHALERVGNVRRRRWLNEKVLRDMAGGMTATDMEAQFKPAPFGEGAPPSLFMRAMAPQHAPLMAHFLNVDMDREARVLERWAEHNAASALSPAAADADAADGGDASSSGRRGGGGGGGARDAHPAAAAALAAWCRVARPARAALKRANPHAVMQMEMRVVEWLEEQQQGGDEEDGESGEQLVLEPEDGFGRILAHALAQFHGLRSCTTGGSAGAKAVTLTRARKPPQPPPRAGNVGTAKTAAAAAAAQRQQQQQLQQRAGDALLCTDVLLAMQELGSGTFDAGGLHRFSRVHLHGGASEAASDDFVFV